MDSFKDSVAFWATVVGTLLAVFGAIQSRSWLLGAGVLAAFSAIGTLGYARQQRELVNSAAVRVAGRSIDSLNAASLQRHLNQSLVIQQARNVAVIDGENLSITWDCTGYCRADRETAIEFSIDADTNVPFDSLDCFAYDLRRDPRRLHRIRPILVGPDGISKKVAVPFLSPLLAQDSFRVLLICKLPGCMREGIDYYTTTLSFGQGRIERCTVQLTFLRDLPQWLRVYEWRSGSAVRLLRDLRPLRKGAAFCEYQDIGEDISAKAARIYVFSRTAPLSGRRKVDHHAKPET